MTGKQIMQLFGVIIGVIAIVMFIRFLMKRYGKGTITNSGTNTKTGIPPRTETAERIDPSQRNAIINSLVSNFQSSGRRTQQSVNLIRSKVAMLSSDQLMQLYGIISSGKQSQTCMGQLWDCLLEPESKPATCYGYYLDCESGIHYK